MRPERVRAAQRTRVDADIEVERRRRRRDGQSLRQAELREIGVRRSEVGVEE